MFKYEIYEPWKSDKLEKLRQSHRLRYQCSCWTVWNRVSIKYNASHDCKLFQPALHFSPPSTSMIDIRLCDDITCNLLKRNTRWSDRSMFLVWMWRLRFSKRWRSVSKQQNLFFLKSPLTEGLFSIEAARLVVRKAEKRPSGYNIGQLGRGYIKQ